MEKNEREQNMKKVKHKKRETQSNQNPGETERLTGQTDSIDRYIKSEENQPNTDLFRYVHP